MKGADIIAVLLLGTGKGIDRTNQRSFAGRIYGADCQGGSRRLGALYHQANTAVYSFALSILKNTSDAEDALHDCFLDIYQAAEHYRPPGQAYGLDFYHCPEPLPAKSCGNEPERRISHQRTGNRICKAVKA